MNKTKIYVVSQNYQNLYVGVSSSVGFFLSKEEAEFYVWSRNQENKKNGNDYSVWSVGTYAFIEVEALSVQKDDKLFKKFREEKKKQLEEELQRKLECKDNDILEIERINKEIETFL